MNIRNAIATLSLLALASCGELITTEPPAPVGESTSYGWSAAVGASVLTSSDGSNRKVEVKDDGSTTLLIDSSESGVDTLRLETHRDSVIVSGISHRSFLPLPFGGSLADTDFTNTAFPATALLGYPDTVFFASGNTLLKYDSDKDAAEVRATFPAPIQSLDWSLTKDTWYVITRDAKLWVSNTHGASWTSTDIPGGATVRAAEASPFGTIYIATDGADILRYDGVKWSTAVTITTPHPITCLKYYSFGPNITLYAGTSDGYVLTLPLSGAQHAEPMITGGRSVPINGIALDFSGKDDRIWAAGNGATFEGRGYGQTWRALPGLADNVTAIYNFGDHVTLGTADGNILNVHEDDPPSAQNISTNAVTALGSSQGEMQAIAGGVLFGTSKQQHNWKQYSTGIRIAHAHVRPWVFLTKDTVWKAADVRVGGARFTYMGRVLDHAPKMQLHGREHKDILVVRYAVESGDPRKPDIDSTAVPMYVVYFEAHRGPVRIETLQKGKPDLIEEVE